MSTLAIAVLLASMVAKEVLESKRAAIIGAVAYFLTHLAFQEHPAPILLSAPICFAALWSTFLLIERATIMLMPLAIIAVMAAVGITESTQSWLVTTLQMHNASTQAFIDEYNQKHPDAGTP